MSPIRKYTVLAVIAAVGFSVLGCGTQNPNAVTPSSSGETVHPLGWAPAGHVTDATLKEETCTECHGSDLSGGISKVSCLSCHVNGSPYALTGCTSCHGKPPDGSAAPNVAGAHGEHHAVLSSYSGECKICHSGAGSGAEKHDNGTVDVHFPGEYNAKSGKAVRNADGTCSKVSCHGGQTTPAWSDGTIDVNTKCTLCHSYGTSEFNSFVSGQHEFHVLEEKYPCLACHDAAALAATHFTTLNTHEMEGPASATISGVGIRSYSNYYCVNFCHDTRLWQVP